MRDLEVTLPAESGNVFTLHRKSFLQMISILIIYANDRWLRRLQAFLLNNPVNSRRTRCEQPEDSRFEFPSYTGIP